MSDSINPSYYKDQFPFEVIEITELQNFCKGNAIKYILRAGVKNTATEIEDLQKAEWYIRREIDRLERERIKERDGWLDDDEPF